MRIHLVSGTLMRNNTFNGQPMGDILRRSLCGLTLDRWQRVPLETRKPTDEEPLCDNCARTRRGRQWLADRQETP